ncbi:hypothetical protein CLU92_0958 [Janthinobacterium sp. 61]|nr:hypothetical protein CLU92_0958 [Janthinobacterium sp. 61]
MSIESPRISKKSGYPYVDQPSHNRFFSFLSHFGEIRDLFQNVLRGQGALRLALPAFRHSLEHRDSVNNQMQTLNQSIGAQLMCWNLFERHPAVIQNNPRSCAHRSNAYIVLLLSCFPSIVNAHAQLLIGPVYYCRNGLSPALHRPYISVCNKLDCSCTLLAHQVERYQYCNNSPNRLHPICGNGHIHDGPRSCSIAIVAGYAQNNNKGRPSEPRQPSQHKFPCQKAILS